MKTIVYLRLELDKPKALTGDQVRRAIVDMLKDKDEQDDYLTVVAGHRLRLGAVESDPDDVLVHLQAEHGDEPEDTYEPATLKIKPGGRFNGDFAERIFLEIQDGSTTSDERAVKKDIAYAIRTAQLFFQALEDVNKG